MHRVLKRTDLTVCNLQDHEDSVTTPRKHFLREVLVR